MTTRILLALLTLCLVGCRHRLTPNAAVYRPEIGDLLFQDADGSPLADAIESVTNGYCGARLSHVGIVAGDTGGEPQVIEAGGKGVVLTPLGKFLGRSRDAAGRPKVLVGRVKDRHAIAPALAFARQQLGKPYDRPYVLRGDAYYCSELVWDAFRDAGGKSYFEPAPMTFKDPSTGTFHTAWLSYFQKLGVAIPEGEPGVNPADMSRSEAIEIVHVMGEVTRK